MTDRAATGRLADAEPAIRALAWRLAPIPADRDDLAQVGRLAAWQAETRFDGTGDLLAWMCAKAKWAMIDHLRTHGPYARGGRARCALTLDESAEPVDPADGPEEQVCDRAEVAGFVAWVGSLPERTADAVLLAPPVWAGRWGRTPSRASQIRRQALEARAA